MSRQEDYNSICSKSRKLREHLPNCWHEKFHQYLPRLIRFRDETLKKLDMSNLSLSMDIDDYKKHHVEPIEKKIKSINLQKSIFKAFGIFKNS